MFSDHEVRVRAHQIWVNNGRPEGHAEYHWRVTLSYWREALAELEAEGLAKGGSVPALCAVSHPPIRSMAAPRQDISGLIEILPQSSLACEKSDD